MNPEILGLHHITAIANNAQINYQFYTEVLGLRLVKKTVNFDDPGTYHFYFGNETGAPGTILTFFPWEGIGKGRPGSGMATSIAYSVPNGSLDFWLARFKELNVPHQPVQNLFGETHLSFQDPDGLELTLVVPAIKDERSGWSTKNITPDAALKGFQAVTLTLRHLDATAELLTDVLGYKLTQEQGNRYRFTTNTVSTANILDIVVAPTPGYNAAGTNHHIAFRVKDEEILMHYREKVMSKGLDITPKIDRDYFFSLYFREPGGVLFELATDNPGFERDETLAELGTNLKLPRQYEAARTEIENILPKLT